MQSEARRSSAWKWWIAIVLFLATVLTYLDRQTPSLCAPMEKGVIYSFKMENCTGCKKCDEECPRGFIDML